MTADIPAPPPRKPAEAPRCTAHYDGVQCLLPSGHAGDHRFFYAPEAAPPRATTEEDVINAERAIFGGWTPAAERVAKSVQRLAEKEDSLCASCGRPFVEHGAREAERLRGVVWALAHALARRCLADANANREAPNDWPAGQEWDELASTSQSIFRRIGYDEAGLDREAVIRLLCDEYGNPKTTDPDPNAPPALRASLRATSASEPETKP